VAFAGHRPGSNLSVERVNPSLLSRLRARPKWTAVLVVVLAVLLLARLALPFFLQREINRKLSGVPGYSGQVGRIGVHLYRGAYSLHGVEIKRQNGQVAQPFFSAGLIDFSLAWGELFHGKIVSKIFIDGGQINFVSGPAEESSQLKVDRRWQDVVDAIFPIDITRLEIRNGLIHYLDTAKTPKVDVYIRNLHAVATGLQNRPAEKGVEFPGIVSLEGESIGGGHLVINIQAEPLAAQPHFYFTLSLQHVALPALNDFLRAYANVDVSRGDFQVFVELGAKHGRFEGYVKPFFAHLVFEAPDRKTGGPWHEIWETIVAGLVAVFKNKPQDQLAMKIPIEGDFSGTRAEVGRAIVTMVHNGFIKGLPQDIEGSINAEEVAPKQGATGTSQPVQPGARSTP
jgi:hypothetical protein